MSKIYLVEGQRFSAEASQVGHVDIRLEAIPETLAPLLGSFVFDGYWRQFMDHVTDPAQVDVVRYVAPNTWLFGKRVGSVDDGDVVLFFNQSDPFGQDGQVALVPGVDPPELAEVAVPAARWLEVVAWIEDPTHRYTAEE